MLLRHPVPLTKEIRLKIFHPIISNSFPVRYYGISGTNLPDIPYYTPESRLTYGIPNIFKYDLLREWMALNFFFSDHIWL